ncbi:hypothetical protein [Pseudoalteromonas sp. ECSMB14103]|uniref:hypothetical protein n=1 Tax=Pseudoalteromonas sp. ECSMB14103 TaxID=1580062 RepID=UPI000AF95853|nr:hypothetical protein [Pseudoalteromonas sp. ECSMB14103]
MNKELEELLIDHTQKETIIELFDQAVQEVVKTEKDKINQAFIAKLIEVTE